MRPTVGCRGVPEYRSWDEIGQSYVILSVEPDATVTGAGRPAL